MQSKLNFKSMINHQRNTSWTKCIRKI